jgi:hypothetical protein
MAGNLRSSGRDLRTPAPLSIGVEISAAVSIALIADFAAAGVF